MLDAERTYLTTRDSYAEALRAAAAVVPELEGAVGLPIGELLRNTSRPASQFTPKSPDERTSESDATKGDRGESDDGVKP